MPPEAAAVLGGRVRARRQQLGLRQSDLSGAARVDRVYVSYIERGRRNPSLGVLLRIARALDIDVADLVRGLHRL